MVEDPIGAVGLVPLSVSLLGVFFIIDGGDCVQCSGCDDEEAGTADVGPRILGFTMARPRAAPCLLTF